MSYIYKITNDVNGKIYVGKTECSVEKRFKEHIRDSRKQRCQKRPLYDAINKYGEEHFHIEIIEECNNNEVCLREQYWINKLRTYIGFEDCNGYNATLGGDSKKYKKYDIDEMIKMYNETYNIELISKKFELDCSHIRKLLKANGVILLSAAETCVEKYKNPIYQLELNTLNIVNIFKYRSDVNLYFGKSKNNGTISDALNGRKGNHHAYGYDWYYKNDYLKLYNDNLNKNIDNQIEELVA